MAKRPETMVYSYEWKARILFSFAGFSYRVVHDKEGCYGTERRGVLNPRDEG